MTESTECKHLIRQDYGWGIEECLVCGEVIE